MPEDAIKPTEEAEGDIIYRHWGMEMETTGDSVIQYGWLDMDGQQWVTEHGFHLLFNHRGDLVRTLMDVSHNQVCIAGSRKHFTESDVRVLCQKLIIENQMKIAREAHREQLPAIHMP